MKNFFKTFLTSGFILFSAACTRPIIYAGGSIPDRIEIEPSSLSMPIGIFYPLRATGVFADGSSVDITNFVTWSTSNASVVAMNGSLPPGWVQSIGAGTATITASAGGVSASIQATINNATLQSLALFPGAQSAAVGVPISYRLTGTYSNNTSVDLTTSASWTSSNSSVATVSDSGNSKGTVTPVSAGSATITATFQGSTASAVLTVISATLNSIAVTPSNQSVPLASIQQYTATGTYSNGSSIDVTSGATWSSSSPVVATVGDSSLTKGLVTSVLPGSTVISATLGSITGQTALTVNAATLSLLTVTPANSSAGVNTTVPFTATALYSDSSLLDVTNSVTWASSSTPIATISNTTGSKGVASTVATGSTTISATLGAVSGQTPLTVTGATLQSITVTPANSTIVISVLKQYTATGHYSDGSTQNLTQSVTWSSTNALVATISNSAGTKGRAIGVGLGSSTITATLGSISGSTNVSGILF